MATFSRDRNVAQNYLDTVDEKLKKRGGSILQGSEVQGGFILPTGRSSSFQAGLTGASSSQSFPQTQVLQANIPQQPQGMVAGASSGRIKSATDFVEQINKVAAERQPQAVASSQDGGTIYSDGTIKYPDGTSRKGNPSAYPVATAPDGAILYSDRSARLPEPKLIRQISPNKALYDDGTVRYTYQQTGEGGLSGLVSGVFGQDRVITQEYGNINPIEPTPGNVNYGTDIRTRDLQGQSRNLALPMDAEVVEVLQDDGTQFGSHSGYGNSVLLRLPSGEMLRFSHLSGFGDGVAVGQTLTAGQSIGTPGETGNAYGEHLDLEYYNPQGKIDNPDNFIGFSDPEAVGIKESMTVADNLTPEEQQIAGQYQNDLASARSGAPMSMERLGREQQFREAMNPSRNMSPQDPRVLGEAATSPARSPIAQTVAGAGRTFNAPELGISELIDSPSRDQAGNVVNALGNQMGAPEYQLGEAIKGEVGFSQPAGNAVAMAGSKLGLPEAGVSERIKDIDFSDLVGSARAKVDDLFTRLREEDTNPFAVRKAYAGSGQGLQNTGVQGVQNDVLKDIATKQSITGVGSNIDGTVRTTTGNYTPVQSLAGGGVGASFNRASTQTLGNNSKSGGSSSSKSSSSSSGKSSSSSKSSSAKTSSSKNTSVSKSAPKQSVQRYQSTAKSAPKQSVQRYQSVAPKQSVQKKSTPAPKKAAPKKSAFSKVISFFTRR